MCPLCGRTGQPNWSTWDILWAMLPVLTELLYFKMHFHLSHCLFHRAQINDGSDQQYAEGRESAGGITQENAAHPKGQMNEEKPNEKGQ